MKKINKKESVIVVTGATSGIGYAIAIEYLNLGKKVIGIGRNIEILENLSLVWDDKFIGINHDITSGSIVKKLIDYNIEIKNIDLVVHSAGIARQGVSIIDMPDVDILDVINVNIIATTFIIKEFSELFKNRGYGTFIVLGSVASIDCAPLMAVYSASKSYISQLIQSVRADLHGSKVRFCCINPGTTKTPLLNKQAGLSDNERFNGFSPLEAIDLAKTIFWIHNQPQHVNIQDLTIFPVDQALFVRGVYKENRKIND